MPIEYISVKEYALRNGLSERTVRNYCANGRIEGAVLVGKTWSLPADAVVKAKSKKHLSEKYGRLFHHQPMEQREQRQSLLGLCRVAKEEDDSPLGFAAWLVQEPRDAAL